MDRANTVHKCEMKTFVTSHSPSVTHTCSSKRSGASIYSCNSFLKPLLIASVMFRLQMYTCKLLFSTIYSCDLFLHIFDGAIDVIGLKLHVKLNWQLRI